MRSAPLFIALTGLALHGSGCVADCGSPSQYNGYSYRVFSNPVTSESTNAVFTAGPDFWSYGTPANGLAEWNFQFGQTAQAPATVLINGQPFEGMATVDEMECGLATIDFSGEYTDARTLVAHNFNASLALNLWTEDGLGKLGGYLVWKEGWSHPSGATGNFTADSHMQGDLIGQQASGTASGS